MFGEVEVYYTCPKTNKKELVCKENNIILAGASKTIAEIISGSYYGASSSDFATSTGSRHKGANPTFEASNYAMAAISFGKEKIVYQGVSGNAHVFDPDELEDVSSILTASNVIFAVQPDELAHKDPNHYFASAAVPSTQQYNATGLVPRSFTAPLLPKNIRKTALSIVSGISACLTTCSIPLGSISAGVDEALNELKKRDSGQNKGLGFAPWYFLSYIKGIDHEKKGIQATWNANADSDRNGVKQTAEFAFFEIRKAGGGTSDFSIACDRAISALTRVSNHIGCSVASGGITSAMVFNRPEDITSGDPADYPAVGTTAPYKSALSAVPELDERRNRDVAGFIRHIQSSSTGDKGKGLITQATTVSSVTYLFTLSATDMIASNLYGGINKMGLWVLDKDLTRTRARDKFFYLRNPCRYRLYATKTFSDNILAGVPTVFTGSLDVYWTINFIP